jgi:hypothetical protein
MMQEFLALVSLVNQLLPIVFETVKTVEGMFPQGGQGATKLQMVANIVQEAAKATNAAVAQLPSFVSVLTPVVSGMVTMANATGLFKKSGPASN